MGGRGQGKANFFVSSASMDTILSIHSCKLLVIIKGVSHGRYRKNGEVVGREVLLYPSLYACIYDDALILYFTQLPIQKYDTLF